MLERVKNFMFRGQQAVIRKAAEATEVLAKEEKGASDVVAVVVLIAIILVVAFMFKDALVKLAENVFGQFADFMA